MSSTRKAKPGSVFRQEKFASSPEFERGLLGNLVAARCSLLEREEDRDLIWYLQLVSHRPGGLSALARQLLEKYEDRIGTPSMRKFGVREGQVYDAGQVRAVRAELPYGAASEFRLKGEVNVTEVILSPFDDKNRQRDIDVEAEQQPSSYPAMSFRKICLNAAGDLAADLARFSLDPSIPIDSWPWYFSELSACLREQREAFIQANTEGSVTTEIGQIINDCLDYALDSKCMILVDGLARRGKTFAVKAWCLQHPGRARYVEVPSANDDIGFFRAIAKSLGVSINLNSKAQELRHRIEDVLQPGHLALVFDEAHYLWPNSSYREALPGRINWIMTALVNNGVPVALITTPQFMRSQQKIEDRSSWNSAQFIGRIGHYERLPDGLSQEDLEAVAEFRLPECDARTIRALANYARGSKSLFEKWI